MTELTAKEKRKKQIESQKTWGRPKLPQKVDAMYNNKWGGNLIAYAYDPDPVIDDPVYKKLERMIPGPVARCAPSGAEAVAMHYKFDMDARQMDEKTYNHIDRMPVWFLKLEFLLLHERDYQLRNDIFERNMYMYREKVPEWIEE